MATNVRKNTAKLMVKKLQARLDALYNEQEAMKPQPSPNQAMQTMRAGGMVRGLKKYTGGDTVPYDKYSYFRSRPGYTAGEGSMVNIPMFAQYNPSYLTAENPYINYESTNSLGSTLPQVPNYSNSTGSQINANNFSQGEHNYTHTFDNTVPGDRAKLMEYGFAKDKSLTGKSSAPGSFQTDNSFAPTNSIAYQEPSWLANQNYFNSQNPSSAGNKNPSSAGNEGSEFNWNNVLTGLGAAPLAYNLIAGLQKPEQLNARDYANPEYNNAIGLMSNRRYNVNPALEAINTSERIGRRNMREAGSAGQYLSGLGALSAGRMRAESDVYAQKQNMDNQYMAEEAQLRGSLGSESAQTAWRVSEANAMNRAARRQHIGAATTGVSNWAQLKQLGKNKKEMDLMGLSTLVGTDWFQERFPEFFDYYNKNKKSI